jgi:hypothetical protein
MSFFGALFGGSMSFFKGSFNTEARRRRGAARGRRVYPAAGLPGLTRAACVSLAQVVVGDNEPGESAIRRFRKGVLNSGVLPEARPGSARRSPF